MPSKPALLPPPEPRTGPPPGRGCETCRRARGSARGAPGGSALPPFPDRTAPTPSGTARSVRRTGRILRRPPTLAIAVAIACLVSSPAPAPDASPGAPEAVRSGYEKAAGELLCYCGCARQTLRDCTCGVAFDLRADFERRLAAGESAEAIMAAYIAEHGEQSRNTPPRSGLNLIAWFGPGAGILVAAVIVLLMLRRWAKRGAAFASAHAAAAAGADASGAEIDPFRERVERELREFEP